MAIGDREVTLQQKGDATQCVKNHTQAGPAPRMGAFPCNGPHPGAGHRGAAGGEGRGPSPKDIMLELMPGVGKVCVIKHWQLSLETSWRMVVPSEWWRGEKGGGGRRKGWADVPDVVSWEVEQKLLWALQYPRWHLT